jgi:predicted transcriptional regulator
MENQTNNKVTSNKQGVPKGVKTVDVKRLKRNGMTVSAIAKHIGVSSSAVSYHLGKKRKARTTNTAEVRKHVKTKTSTEFEADLFGTIIKLDRIPASIERDGNRIIIK